LRTRYVRIVASFSGIPNPTSLYVAHLGGCAPSNARRPDSHSFAQKIGALLGGQRQQPADLVAQRQFTLLLENFQCRFPRCPPLGILEMPPGDCLALDDISQGGDL
jgi:hypothetical protein